MIGKTIRFSSQLRHKAPALYNSSKRKNSSRNLALEFADESSLSVLQRKVLIYFTGVKKAQEETTVSAISHCKAEQEGGFICGEGGKK